MGRRAVVGDDDEGIRMVLSSWLPTRDFEVVGLAADGQAVIDLVGTEKPDLVVLDLDMPEVSGLDALPEIRRVSPETRVIVLSDELLPILRSAVEMLGATAVDKSAGLEGLSAALPD